MLRDESLSGRALKPTAGSKACKLRAVSSALISLYHREACSGLIDNKMRQSNVAQVLKLHTLLSTAKSGPTRRCLFRPPLRTRQVHKGGSRRRQGKASTSSMKTAHHTAAL